MRKLAHLPGDALPYFNAIAEAKESGRKERLLALSDSVSASYRAYLTEPINLSALSPAAFTSLDADDLRHCYTSSTAPLERLKAAIDAHQESIDAGAAAMCQYCGLTSSPETYDHYLPKDVFPEFSAFSCNLVPSCERCNTLKGSKWVCAQNKRQIISFYFDPLPRQRFLFADIIIDPKPEAVFRLSDNPEDYGELETVVRSHFRELHLLDRFKTASPAEFSDLEIELGPEVVAVGGGAVAQMLLRKATNMAISKSPNYWKVALLYGMAGSAEFVDWCKTSYERRAALMLSL